jgi:hypothetical protein
MSTLVVADRSLVLTWLSQLSLRMDARVTHRWHELAFGVILRSLLEITHSGGHVTIILIAVTLDVIAVLVSFLPIFPLVPPFLVLISTWVVTTFLLIFARTSFAKVLRNLLSQRLLSRVFYLWLIHLRGWWQFWEARNVNFRLQRSCDFWLRLFQVWYFGLRLFIIWFIPALGLFLILKRWLPPWHSASTSDILIMRILHHFYLLFPHKICFNLFGYFIILFELFPDCFGDRCNMVFAEIVGFEMHLSSDQAIWSFSIGFGPLPLIGNFTWIQRFLVFLYNGFFGVQRDIKNINIMILIFFLETLKDFHLLVALTQMMCISDPFH